VVAQPLSLEAVRAGPVAGAIREERLIVVLRGVEPRGRLVTLVEELADLGVRIFEVTFDAPAAVDDLHACIAALRRVSTARAQPPVVGAGTIRTSEQLAAAVGAGAAFGVSPILDPAVLAEAHRLRVPFVPGALSPSEIDRAWRLGATFVKVFPASAVGPGFIRELHGPMPEIETIATGGIDVTNARAFLDSGATAVGIGSALVRASAEERRSLIASVRDIA
jgi:2-dehydro-3-deoxyphosphogluconate aldolase / (4S)-4-hydroxy-2-oxoglutarate aldolase